MCQNENCNCKKPYYITTAIAYTSGKPHMSVSRPVPMSTVRKSS